MTYLKLIAAALALLALNACVGFVVPLPASGSGSAHEEHHDADRDQRR
ncbi:MAG: hypothetical protein WC830_02145 [Burkholderiales bacterium]